jgi:Na+-driven multidrug efflux pump/anti-sigma regulatory factor (Ser/Thr protein kinase)
VESFLMEDNNRFIENLYRQHAASNSFSLMLSVLGPLCCTILAGRNFGENGLSVLAVCAPLFFIGAFIGMTFSGGGSILAARAVSEDEEKTPAVLYSASAVLTFSVSAVACAALLIFQNQLLHFLGSDAPPSLSGYYVWSAVNVIVTSVLWVPLNFCRLAGRPVVAPVMTSVMVLTSVGSAFLLIEPLGLPGIALAQLIGGVCALITAMFMMRRSTFHLRSPGRTIPVATIVVAGSPGGLSRLYQVVSIYILNAILLSTGGVFSLAVFAAIQMIHRFISALIIGTTQTLLPLAGVLDSERDSTGLSRLMAHAFFFGNSLTGIACVILLIFRSQIAILFGLTDTSLLFGYAVALYAIYALLLQNITFYIAYFTARTSIATANLLLFLQEFFFLVGPALILSVLRDGDDVWMAFPLSGILTFGVLAILLLWRKKQNPALSLPFLIDRTAKTSGNDLSFSVEGDEAAIAQSAEQIYEFCAEKGLTHKQNILISMSVEEFLLLIVNNAPANSQINLSVRLVLDRDKITMRIRNKGEMFDPLKYYNSHISDDVEKSLDVIGIKYIAENAQRIYYRNTFGVNNLVLEIDRMKDFESS